MDKPPEIISYYTMRRAIGILGILRAWRDQARLAGKTDGTGKKGHAQDGKAAQVPGEVILPVVPSVGKEKEGYGAVISHEDVPHIRMIIGADGSHDGSLRLGLRARRGKSPRSTPADAARRNTRAAGLWR